jgi:hypothetical protein
MGLPQDYLWRLHRRGLLKRVGRGLYAVPDAEATEHHSSAEVCKRVPRGATADEVWKYAKVCRVTRVIRPYLEVIR